MKKVILLSLIALVLGVAGGTAFRLPKLKAEQAAADSLEAVTAAGSGAEGAGEYDDGSATEAYTASGAETYGAAPETYATQTAPTDDGTPEEMDPYAALASDRVDDASQSGAAPSEVVAQAPPAQPLPAPEQEPQGPEYSEEGAKKLAEIFEAMAPDAAAAVLEGLEAVEIQVILQRMSSRRAAEVLTAMPPELAASLSKIVLIDRNGGR